MRIKFKKGKSRGDDQSPQREFLKEVLANAGCPSLKELINRGINVNYSTLKNYSSEARLIPRDLYLELCKIAGISENKFKVDFVDDNWGQIKGGKKGKK